MNEKDKMETNSDDSEECPMCYGTFAKEIDIYDPLTNQILRYGGHINCLKFCWEMGLGDWDDFTLRDSIRYANYECTEFLMNQPIILEKCMDADCYWDACLEYEHNNEQKDNEQKDNEQKDNKPQDNKPQDNKPQEHISYIDPTILLLIQKSCPSDDDIEKEFSSILKLHRSIC